MHLIQKNKMMTSLAAILLCGEGVGILFSRSVGAEASQTLTILIENSLSRQVSQEAGTVFVASMFSCVLLLLLCFLFGLSLWGLFFAPLVPLFQGIGLGLSSAFLFHTMGMKGIAFFVLAVLPGAFLSAVAVLLAAQESLKASYRLLKREIHKETAPLAIHTYFIRFGILSLLSILSALADTFTSLWFAPYFLLK